MAKELSAFEKAFAAARKKGKSKFIFHGKSYTTELAEPKKKATMTKNLQKKNQGFNIKKGKINEPVLKKKAGTGGGNPFKTLSKLVKKK
tara:strand:- start:2233 stop:2499 length:267 start_codon:yes stop_codon:yes gene_type:complete